VCVECVLCVRACVYMRVVYVQHVSVVQNEAIFCIKNGCKGHI